MSTQTQHITAPQLRVSHWIDGKGMERAPLKLEDLGPGYKVIYCFQAWCPGCHSRGFPTLKKLVDNLSDKGFGFAAVQTVFEGKAENTVGKLREMQKRYDLNIPFGHDVEDSNSPTIMEDYRTGGTPWFLLINPKGEVVFSDFHLNADYLIKTVSAQ